MSDGIDTVKVNLPGRPYNVLIAPGMLDASGRIIHELCPVTRAFMVTDGTVRLLYAERTVSALQKAGIDVELIAVPAGDASKSLEQAGKIYDALAARAHGRGEPIIALGGGMVGDLAGFVAATWMRGVPFVQLPTTLEADIDAAVGGKTAINHAAGKNLIGAFHQPVVVLIDTNCLDTLDERDYIAGLAESVKHAIIRDAKFFAWHEENAASIRGKSEPTVRELIRRNCQIKADVVAADERESATDGVGRAALNFGHTIGHAIEAQFNYELRHGEAVALGMIAALDLAVATCGLPEKDRERIEVLLSDLGLPRKCPSPLDPDDLVNRLRIDKKSAGTRPRFVLLESLGRVKWAADIGDDQIRSSLGRIIPD